MIEKEFKQIIIALILNLISLAISILITEGMSKNFFIVSAIIITLFILFRVIKKWNEIKIHLKLILSISFSLIIIIMAEIYVVISIVDNQQKILKIGLVHWTGIAPFFVAQEKNLFDDINIEIEIIQDMGKRRYLMFKDKIQAYSSTIDMFECCPRIACPSPGKISWAIDKSIGGDAIVAHSDINMINNKNKQLVSGAEFGDATHYLLLKFLDIINIPIFKTDFKSLSLEQVNSHFLKGELHIAGISEPRLSDLLKLDESAKIIFSSSDLPDDFAIIDVLVIDEKSLKERKNDWIKIYKGWCRALQYIKEEPDRACQIMANYMKVDQSVIKNGLKRMILYGDVENKQLFNFENDNSIDKIFRNIGQYLKSKDLNHEMFSPSEKITTEIVYSN